MKKIALFLLLVFIMFLQAEIIEKTYHFEDYKISQIDEYQIINFSNTMPSGKSGEPVLPYHSMSLLVPPGEVAESIEFIGENETQIPGNFNLYPKQYYQPISFGGSGKFVKNDELYARDAQYPDSQISELSTEFMNGYALVLSTFTPMSYNPSLGKISFYQEVTIRIQTKPDIRAEQALDNLNSSKQVQKRIEYLSQNPELMSVYPTSNFREGDYQLLIITNSQFENDFQDLINMYLSQGMKTEIQTTEYIYSNVTGQDSPEKIRNYIIDEYQNDSIEFVLLAGDIEIVPYRGFYCTVQSSSIYEDNDIPSDLYYSALDGTWNDDGDNLWGEIGEDDLLPEVSVARLPFSNLTELENMLNKTISYQDDPVLGDLQKPFLAGEHMWDDPLTWGGDYLDLLIGYHDDNGYTTNGIPEDHDYETMYDRDLGSWSSSDLIAKINEGKSFIHHAGHASSNYSMRMNSNAISNSNFSLVNGIDHTFTLAYSHGCNSGSFDSNDCIGEKMLYIENFAAAFVCNSRYGWFNEGQTEGPSLHIHREFMDALYDCKTDRIGQTHLESKIDTAPWVNAPGQHEEGALRWCFYDCNTLGDPAMSIWTDEPLDIVVNHDPFILVGAPYFFVEIFSLGNPVEGLTCVLMKDGELHGVGVTGADGSVDIQIDPPIITEGETDLIITGYNCLKTTFSIPTIPSGYYINLIDYSVNAGNDDVIEFGESASLTISIQNVGGAGDIHNVVAALSISDEYITLTDSTEQVGTITPNETIILSDAFSFDVDNSIPNNHELSFVVTITSDEGTWEHDLDLIGYAPVIFLESVEVWDGGNGVLDPGEEACLAINLVNEGGADAYDLIPGILSNDPYISIVIAPLIIDSLAAYSSGTFGICDVIVDPETPIGHIIDFDFELSANNDYYIEDSFSLTVGLSIEDFETGDFTSYSWQFDGDADWTIDSDSYEGQFCAKSGDIDNSSSSSLIIELDVVTDGEISFWKKVSCEDDPNDDWDYLAFFIDNVEQARWDGEIDWSEEIFSVNAGNHTFKWEYTKDGYVSTGDDCGWIDYIIFPPISENVDNNNNISAPIVTKLIGNYPNPFNPTTTISFELNTENTEDTEIIIYNLKGQKVKTLDCGESLSTTADGVGYSISWNGKDDSGKSVTSGIYFYKLKTENYSSTRKMLLLK